MLKQVSAEGYVPPIDSDLPLFLQIPNWLVRVPLRQVARGAQLWTLSGLLSSPLATVRTVLRAAAARRLPPHPVSALVSVTFIRIARFGAAGDK